MATLTGLRSESRAHVREPTGVLTTYIDEFDGTASLDRALATAEYYGLSPTQARRIAGDVWKAVSGWREAATRLRASRREIDRMESAFEHEDLGRALR